MHSSCKVLLKGCHPNGKDFKFIVYMTHISISISNVQHYKQQNSCNHFNAQMVLLYLESWTSQWCHLIRGVGYHEPRQFSEPVEQCDRSFHLEWLQISFILMAMMSLIPPLSNLSIPTRLLTITVITIGIAQSYSCIIFVNSISIWIQTADQPGFEPGSPGHKAVLLTIELHSIDFFM